jgi:Uma2 family endonuclease
MFSHMSAVQQRSWTLAEFLDWEERQPLRYEFDGSRIVDRNSGTAAHAAIQVNLAVSIQSRLHGRSSNFVGSSLKVEVAGSVRYPDGFVFSSRVSVTATIIREPVVIFEVLAPETASADLVTKNLEYSAAPSVQRYVVLAQDRVGGLMFERIGDDWRGRLLNTDTVINMPEIDIEVPLSEFYVGLEFPPEADEV